MHLDLEDLAERVDAGADARVSWRVTCAIGPDWIGAERTVEVTVDGAPVEAPDLVAALIAAFALPERLETEAIFGGGVLELTDGALTLHYEWSRSVPYQPPSAFDVGELVLSP